MTLLEFEEYIRKGIVKKQYPIAGSKIDKDSIVKIICGSK